MVPARVDAVGAGVQAAIGLLGRKPTRAEYDRLAAEHDWPRSPDHG